MYSRTRQKINLANSRPYLNLMWDCTLQLLASSKEEEPYFFPSDADSSDIICDSPPPVNGLWCVKSVDLPFKWPTPSNRSWLKTHIDWTNIVGSGEGR